MSLTLILPDAKDQHAFNRRCWNDLLSSGEMERFSDCRVETDRYGHVVMSPYASGLHGAFQSEISNILAKLMDGGRTFTECPVSTSNGVKLVDAAWMGRERFNRQRELSCYECAPEICVEVLSPSNTRAEMEEKRMLYFEVGCAEFWTVTLGGKVQFFDSSGGEMEASEVCPEFPSSIAL